MIAFIRIRFLPGELSRYSVEGDPHAETDIANYVHGQAPDETVQHVERVKREVVLGEVYDIWDVTTDKDRWWVLTNLTNLYSQRHFPSLDYTSRIRSRRVALSSRGSSAARTSARSRNVTTFPN